uniref:Sodium/hydrogen exchanger n=3 Tax=Cacopsylla melanoneura TaxID=428564 RepID=A0A8D9EMN0_9HEMI
MSFHFHLFILATLLTLTCTNGRSVSSADIAVINPQVGNKVNALIIAPVPTETTIGLDCVTTPIDGASVVTNTPMSDETEGHEVGNHYGHLNANHKAENVKRYRVAAIEFHRVETPFIIAVWILSASLAKIGFHMAPQLNQMFPESCLLIVVGVVIGLLLLLTTNIHIHPLTPDTFFLYMLPPIILDAGYFMPNRLFFDHLGTILLFAVIGTIFNTLSIGISLWAVGQSGMFGPHCPLLEMLLFAALISAVDPVAVLAVFEEIHVNEILYIVVFGESLLNDAVTVVLYHMFEAYSEMGHNNVLYVDLLSGLASFFVVAIGGTFIGVVWGFLTGFVTRFTNEVRVIEPIFIFVMAYLAYLNAEIFHMSGILAITFCGITMKNYVEANISHKSHTTVKYAMKMLSSSSETIIFMFLGIATISDTHVWNTAFVILTIFFCSLYRTLGVIILTAIVNHFRIYKLTTVDKFVMCYGGLRGAVAFALVLLIDPKFVKLQPMFVTTTIAVIYFTVFFQGITIKPLVKILNVKTGEKKKPSMNERIHERLMDHVMAGVEDILGRHGNHHVRDRFKRFDNRFIRPYILRDHKQGAEPKILETYSKLAMKDAMEFMRRNASTIGGGSITGTDSMSAIFRNYTTGNLNGSSSLTQLDNTSNWNIDLQELDYNPSKKDMTDAKIHHLLTEELCMPQKRHRRLSYSRHTVDDRDLTTQVNYKVHTNMCRRLMADRKHHHRRSKRLNKDGSKQSHVTFPGIQQNGSAKQFTSDYIDEVLLESEVSGGKDGKSSDWECGGITFSAHPSSEPESSPPTDNSPVKLAFLSLPGLKKATSSFVRNMKDGTGSNGGGDYRNVPTVAECSLPWRRRDDDILQSGNEGVSERERGAVGGEKGGGGIRKGILCRTKSQPPAMQASQKAKECLHTPATETKSLPAISPLPMSRRLPRDLTRELSSVEGSRVSTPTALEKLLPWKRGEEEDSTTSGVVKQNEFPAWCSNKEYLAYNSPSSTFLGIFRRDSNSDRGSGSNAHPSVSDAEHSPSFSSSSALLIDELSVNPLLLSPYTGKRLLPSRRNSALDVATIVEEDAPQAGILSVSADSSTGDPGPPNVPGCEASWLTRSERAALRKAGSSRRQYSAPIVRHADSSLSSSLSSSSECVVSGSLQHELLSSNEDLIF